MLLILLVAVQLFRSPMMFSSGYKLFCVLYRWKWIQDKYHETWSRCDCFLSFWWETREKVVLLAPFNGSDSVLPIFEYKFGNWPRARTSCHNSFICPFSYVLTSICVSFSFDTLWSFIYLFDDHHSIIFVATFRTKYLWVQSVCIPSSQQVGRWNTWHAAQFVWEQLDIIFEIVALVKRYVWRWSGKIKISFYYW